MLTWTSLCIYCVVFIHGHLGWFCSLAFMPPAAINMYSWGSVCCAGSDALGYEHGVVQLSYMVGLSVVFCGKLHTDSCRGCVTGLFFHQQTLFSLFPAFHVTYFPDDSHLDCSEAMSPCRCCRCLSQDLTLQLQLAQNWQCGPGWPRTCLCLCKCYN